VRLEPDASDADRVTGWYDWEWREVEDPTRDAQGDEEFNDREVGRTQSWLRNARIKWPDAKLYALLAKTDAAAKVSKESVDYGYPRERGERCGLCSMFMEPDACTHVRGEIDRLKWCEDFQRK
jgi:hypothetical protein